MTNVPPLSPIALARLQDQQRPFTSDLSVNELATVEHAGFRPLGLVMGSSVFHVGLQSVASTQSVELSVLSGAMYTARTWAMARMRTEAEALGADGVAGVRVELRKRAGLHELIDFVAIGTALKAEQGVWRTPAGAPFTSSLSGEELWTLVRSGYAPVSFVLGAAVWHVPRLTLRQMLAASGQNVELSGMTQALYDAREVAMTRMQVEAEREQAHGIVDVHVTESSHVWGVHTIEFLATGTAVRPLPDDTVVEQTRPRLFVLPLSDRPVPVVGRIPTGVQATDYDSPGAEGTEIEAGGAEGGEGGDAGDSGVDFDTGGPDFDSGGSDFGGGDSGGGGGPD